MNRSKLLVASMGGAVFLSFAQCALATDAGAGANDTSDAQYKVALAQCDMVAITRQGACRAWATLAHDDSKIQPFVINRSYPTDSQGRLQLDP